MRVSSIEQVEDDVSIAALHVAPGFLTIVPERVSTFYDIREIPSLALEKVVSRITLFWFTFIHERTSWTFLILSIVLIVAYVDFVAWQPFSFVCMIFRFFAVVEVAY